MTLLVAVRHARGDHPTRSPAGRAMVVALAPRECGSVGLMRPLLVAVVMIALAACGSSASRGANANNATAASDSEMRCRDEVQIGSSIPRPVCRTKQQDDDAREDAQEMLGGPHPKARRGRRR
jgi:hypothetical protein